MKSDAIIEALSSAIESKIFKEWKHEGGVLGVSSEHINVEIDGKEYVIVLKEVEAGKHFSEYFRQETCDHKWEYYVDKDIIATRKRRCELCGKEETR